MRVISGTARKIKLETLPGNEITRPTTDRVKEGIFSAIQFIIPGANVLDLFAGSGQMGIETLSRGAAHCTFVDENAQAINIIKQNLNSTSLAKNASVINKTAQSYLQHCTDIFDLILLDPPYINSDLIVQILPALNKLSSSGAIIIAETSTTTILPKKINNLVVKKVYKYGSISVTKYEKT